ncbi:MAG: methylated-DNA--[protein]-cysteine S-methyltransferase [Alphaproteobacteria bacterium]
MTDADDICVLDSPVGRLRAEFAGGTLLRLGWTRQPTVAPASAAARALAAELAAYFAGELRRFAVPADPRGTPFQRALWDAMVAIPYGETRSYGAVAAELGASARAVGTACGDNPIPIVVPCHRILAADGMGGYSGRGGLATKRALLRLEGARMPAEQLDLPLG